MSGFKEKQNKISKIFLTIFIQCNIILINTNRISESSFVSYISSLKKTIDNLEDIKIIEIYYFGFIFYHY